MDSDELISYPLLAFYLGVIAAISCRNACLAGRSWSCTRQLGGWSHRLNRLNFAVAALGFSWCNLTPVAVVAHTDCMFGFADQAMLTWLKAGHIIAILLAATGIVSVQLRAIALVWRRHLLDQVATAGDDVDQWAENALDIFNDIGPALAAAHTVFVPGVRGGGVRKAAAIVLASLTLTAGVVIAAIVAGASARLMADDFREDVEREQRLVLARRPSTAKRI